MTGVSPADTAFEITVDGPQPLDLDRVVAGLTLPPGTLAERIAGFEAFGRALLTHPAAAPIEGVAYLAAWLRRRSLERLVVRSVGNAAVLDGLVPDDAGSIGTAPKGIVAMWLAGNVPTLPVFSVVPALLGGNRVVVKLPAGENAARAMAALLGVLAEAAPGLAGALRVVQFSRSHKGLNAALSLAADAKVIWGTAGAIEAVRALPERAHTTTVAFGPRYSLAIVTGQRLLRGDLKSLWQALAVDIAAFDQRACSSPHTIFVECIPSTKLDELRAFADGLAESLDRLPEKALDDDGTTTAILNARADYAMGPDTDVRVSRGTAWTVLVGGPHRLEDAIQSRTVFLKAVAHGTDVLPLIGPAVQTVGLAAEPDEFLPLASALCARGAVRVVRPGLMSAHDTPWDGQLLLAQLVRWISVKP